MSTTPTYQQTCHKCQRQQKWQQLQRSNVLPNSTTKSVNRVRLRAQTCTTSGIFLNKCLMSDTHARSGISLNKCLMFDTHARWCIFLMQCKTNATHKMSCVNTRWDIFLMQYNVQYPCPFRHYPNKQIWNIHARSGIFLISYNKGYVPLYMFLMY